MYRQLKTLIAATALAILPMFGGQALAQTPEASGQAATSPAPLQVALLDLQHAGALRGGDYGV